MGIYIKMNYENLQLLSLHRDAYHEALAGTGAYVKSEIAIVEEDGSSFTLCIGESNDNDVGIDINISEDSDIVF